jgi:hypothetical protein
MTETLEMSRSVSQLLFSYLPDKTVNWKDGAGIVRLGGARLGTAWPSSAASFVLGEVGIYLDRWKSRGGEIDRRFPPPDSVDRFSVGTPRSISASMLETPLYCRECFRFFPQKPRLRGDRLLCPGCGRQTLRQIGYVFVHGCGAIESIGETIRESNREPGTIFKAWIRCPNCRDGGLLRLDERADRLAALKISCERCMAVVVDRFLARCPRCYPRLYREAQPGGVAGQLAFQSAMRITRHSANNAYYAHSLSILRLDLPRVTQTSPEQAWLDGLLPVGERGVQFGAAQGIGELAERLRRAEREGDRQLQEQLRQSIVTAATSPQAAPTTAQPVPTPTMINDVMKSVRECVSLLSSVRRSTIADRGAQGGVAARESAATLIRLGLAKIETVSNLPVIAAVFGYTRRSADPTYQEEAAAAPFPTTLRPFPVLDREAARVLARPQAEGTVPILAREGSHEGLALYLSPSSVLEWLGRCGVPVPGETEQGRLTALLGMLEPVQPFFDDVWELPVRRLVFGLLHSFSHCALKALGRVGGMEATSVAEYLFPPLLATVVYSTATVQLGGVQAVARHRLAEFLDVLQEEAARCLYDPDCLHRDGACHGCIQVPEISCRAFNHGLSRSFLVGGRTPWAPASDQTRVLGYWELTAAA